MKSKPADSEPLDAGFDAKPAAVTLNGCERDREFIDIAVRRLTVTDAALPW